MPKTSREPLDEPARWDVALGDDDHARLADLHGKLAPQLGDIAQRFVDRVAVRDAAGLTSTKQARRLRSTLLEWLESSLAGPHDEQFGARHSSLSRWHIAAGLSQRHALMAIHVVRSEYHDWIEELYAPSERRLVVKSVDRLLDVELASLLRDPLDAEAELAAREGSAQSQRIAAIRTLSAGLAHEVRNPLNSASLQLELLERRLRRGAADRTLIEPVQNVGHELERLTRLLNEFLAFVRPSELALDDHDISAIVREAVDAQRPFAAARGAEIQIAGLSTLRAHVDVHKLRLIVQNLLRNALEAVAADGQVIVRVDGDGDQVRLTVEDDGPAIPLAIRSRIYEPFFTTKDTGTGLGLSIVHGMVAAHGGTIALDSSAQRTRFDVSLPRFQVTRHGI